MNRDKEIQNTTIVTAADVRLVVIQFIWLNLYPSSVSIKCICFSLQGSRSSCRLVANRFINAKKIQFQT